MSAAIPVAVSALWGRVTTQLAVNEIFIIGSVGILTMLAISIVPVIRSENMKWGMQKYPLFHAVDGDKDFL